MPAVNPRIAVYLPRSTAATIQRLAGLRGVSRSAVIREFLVEAEPLLQRVSNLLDLAARTDRTALKEWAATMEAEQGKIEASALDVFAQAESSLDGAERHMAAHPAKGPKARAARALPRRGKPRSGTPGQ
jgi:hypothetical protein